MNKRSTILLLLIFSSQIWAGPILQMNRALNALLDLIPYISSYEKFVDKKNAPLIEKKISELQSAFKSAKHDPLLKEDLFAPSYALIRDNLSDSEKAFKAGKKDYAHWRLKEITANCLDCHTRMPETHASSFQRGELVLDQKKFENVYNLGIAQLIVRRYSDAKTSFTRDIDEKLIKNDLTQIILPLKQLLLTETKVLKNPENIQSILNEYKDKKNLPEEVRTVVKAWLSRLKHWQGQAVLKKGLQSDKDVDAFIAKELGPLKKKGNLSGEDVDLLFASGLLSNYLFENSSSKRIPEIIYWLGWSEKILKQENFFGSGDLFLKQCIKHYPAHPIAKKCFEEYKESVDFEFSGSSGTDIPLDVQKELSDLEKMIKNK